jgi:hypothetical protein
METTWEEGVFNEDIPLNSDPNEVDYNYNSVLLEKFFPSLTGKAKVLDEFLYRDSKNPSMENPWKRRVKKDNILFCREHSEDPDGLVRNALCSFFCVLPLLN